MRLKRLIAALAMTLSSFAVEAGLFNFSYTFYDGSVVSGSFAGDVNGQFVDNVSGISAFLNGNTFSGSPNLYAFTDLGAGWTNSAPPRVSFDGNLNSFLFIDSPILNATLYTNYFAIDNIGSYHGARALTPYHDVIEGPNFGQGPFDGSRWTLTVVPEPGTLVFLVLGLAGLGFCGRRKM